MKAKKIDRLIKQGLDEPHERFKNIHEPNNTDLTLHIEASGYARFPVRVSIPQFGMSVTGLTVQDALEGALIEVARKIRSDAQA